MGCHIPGGDTSNCTQDGGCLQQGGRGQGCGCLQPGCNYSWHSISSSTGHHLLPAASMWGPDFPPWCPTAAQWCWQAEAPTLRATLAHPGAPYQQHLAHPKAGKGVTHMEMTPRTRSSSLWSPRVLPGPSPAPHDPQLDGKAAPGLELCPWECHQYFQGDSGRCIHWKGCAQTDVTQAQLDTGEWSPPLRHQWDPDLSHSFRLSLQ